MIKTIIGSIASAFMLLSSAFASAQTGDLPRSTPEAEGVPSRAISALFDSLMALPRTEIHSIVVVRHGKVIAETYPTPFKPEYRHTMYSCSKTFVGAAVGLAIADNRLRLTDRVATFFPESLPATVTPELADMTVRHLLTMTSGIDPDWNMRNITPDWIATYLGKKCAQPGTAFKYDSICTYLLAAIVQKVTGMSLLDYLKMKIFDSMHITDVEWEVSPEGFNTGGWGLHIQPESLAKFGILLINGGCWNGKQLIPAEWVREMTSSQMKTYGNDYCYQTWRCDYPGTFRADGALGQYILMIPEKDIVVVITECTMIDGKRQRHLVWDILLPSVTDGSLPEGKDTATLRDKAARYSLDTPTGKPSGKYDFSGKTFKLSDNRLEWTSIALKSDKKRITASITLADGNRMDVDCGFRQWLTSTTEARPPYSVGALGRFTGISKDFAVAGSYAWKTGSKLVLKLEYANWVTALDVEIDFSGNEARITAQENYSDTPIAIVGKAE